MYKDLGTRAGGEPSAVDNRTTAGGGTIEDGRYALRVLPAPKCVMISASRQVAGRDLYGEKFYLEGYVPRCYNKKTILGPT